MAKNKTAYLIAMALFVAAFSKHTHEKHLHDDGFVSYTVNPASQDIKLFWNDEKGVLLNNFDGLKAYLANKGETLVFATNAGMFKPDFSPVGLYIQEQKTIVNMDTSSGVGNFYLKPNGVFYVTTNQTAHVCETNRFVSGTRIKYATQSGPMLVIDGNIHPAFKQGSNNKNIRNGVGILPNGYVVFAMSKTEINFHDFASYFKNMGCKNALYLDGFVSRTYLPEKNWIQPDGRFGVMVGITKPLRK